MLDVQTDKPNPVKKSSKHKHHQLQLSRIQPMRELGGVLIRCSRGHLLCDMFKIFLWMMIHLERPFKDEHRLDDYAKHTHTYTWVEE